VLDRQATVVLPGEWPPGDEEGSDSVDLPFGRVGTLEGIPSPARVRRTAGAKPGILVVSSEDPFPAGRFGSLQRLTIERYRAIENRKWVVHSAPESVMLLDSEGRIAMQFQGPIPSAGIEQIEILGTSPYARWGWRIEPLCTAMACVLLLAGALRPAFRRRGGRESPPQRQ
jgi:apolipoprotein N-acyltransferase